MKRVPALVVCLAAGCAEAPPPQAVVETQTEAHAEAPGVGDLVAAVIQGAAFGQHYIGQARDVATTQLLNELAASDADADASPFADGALDAAAARLEVRWPADFREVLAVPAAWRTLGWSEPADFARAEALGDALGTKLKLGADWRRQEATVEDFHGGSFRVPAAALERYVVIAQNPFFDDVLLFDPTDPPQYPCCRLVETPVFDSDSVTGYASVRDYLEVAWAMMKVDR